MDPECYKAGAITDLAWRDSRRKTRGFYHVIMYNKHIVLFLNAYISSYIHILVNTICI